MKIQRTSKTRSLLALLLSLIFIFGGLSVVVFATEPVDTTAGTEVDTQTFLPTIEGEAFESDVIISPPMVSIGGEEEISPMATQILPNGIYSFKNKGNTGLYMDTQYDSTNVGYKLQQYAYSASPTTTVATDNIARGGLFKVSYRADLDSYIIRSMTNNLLSYEFKDGYVVTKQIHADDASVAAADTFKIVRVSGTSVTITPYNQTNCIAAKNTNKSGSAGAPDSYLIPGSTATSGDQALWQPVKYTGSVTRSGYVMAQEPSAEDLVAGETVTFKVKTWSTQINYNIPYLFIQTTNVAYGDFNDDSVTLDDLFTLSVEIYHEGSFALAVEARNGTLRIPLDTLSYSTVLPIAEGIYFFMNRQTEKYMQIDDVGSTTMEVFSFDGDTDQKWSIEHHTGKYYKIRSIENNLYVTVPSGSYDSNNVSLQLQSFTGASGQLWYFETSPSSTSSYIIRPKSGENKTTDWCINVKTTIFGTSASDVVQSDFNDNTSYFDEWMLDPHTITLCGITNYGHDHLGCLEDVQESMHDNGISHVNLISGSLTPDACLNYLKNTNVFTSRSHGGKIQYEGRDDIVSTGILLNDGEGETAVALFSNHFLGMNDVSKVISSTDSFANTDLVLFIGCETAAGGENGRNLPSVVVSQGAEVAIGFTESIDCEVANEWTIEFYSYMLQGKTVQEAVDLASEGKSEASGLKSAVICGNKNYVLY